MGQHPQQAAWPHVEWHSLSIPFIPWPWPLPRGDIPIHFICEPCFEKDDGWRKKGWAWELESLGHGKVTLELILLSKNWRQGVRQHVEMHDAVMAMKLHDAHQLCQNAVPHSFMLWCPLPWLCGWHWEASEDGVPHDDHKAGTTTLN
jgi:hypothetical protein